jgi:hypothetical protein
MSDIFFNPAGPFCSLLYLFKGEVQTDWKYYQCSELVCPENSFNKKIHITRNTTITTTTIFIHINSLNYSCSKKTAGISFRTVQWEIKSLNTRIFLSLSLSNKILKKKTMVRKSFKNWVQNVLSSVKVGKVSSLHNPRVRKTYTGCNCIRGHVAQRLSDGESKFCRLKMSGWCQAGNI